MSIITILEDLKSPHDVMVGDKIESIKRIRELTNCDLRDAKEFYENYEGNPQALISDWDKIHESDMDISGPVKFKASLLLNIQGHEFVLTRGEAISLQNELDEWLN